VISAFEEEGERVEQCLENHEETRKGGDERVGLWDGCLQVFQSYGLFRTSRVILLCLIL